MLFLNVFKGVIIIGISSRYIFVDRGRMINMFKIRNIEKNIIYLKKVCNFCIRKFYGVFKELCLLFW